MKVIKRLFAIFVTLSILGEISASPMAVLATNIVPATQTSSKKDSTTATKESDASKQTISSSDTGALSTSSSSEKVSSTTQSSTNNVRTPGVHIKNKDGTTKNSASTTNSKTVNVTISNQKIVSASGESEITGKWSAMYMSFNFSVPESANEGDATEITLPENLKFANNQSFNVTDNSGNVVAKAVINANTKTLTLTYTDYVDKHSDVSGSIQMTVYLDQNNVDVTKDQNIPVVIDVAGNTVKIGKVSYTVGKGDTEQDFYKYSNFDYEKNEIVYVIRINTTNSNVSNVVIKDSLINKNAKMSYNEGSVSVVKGHWYRNSSNEYELENQTNVSVTPQFDEKMEHSQ